MEQAKYDVFISYSRKDYVKNDEIIPGNPVSAIIKLFDKNGISYWIDKEGIYGGGRFMSLISDAIADSRMMVFVSSINSNKSPWTAGELLEAIEGNKHIIPVRIDECQYNKDYRIRLLPLDHVDYYVNSQTALMKLLRAVNKEKKRIEKEKTDAQKKQIVSEAINDIKEKAKEFHALTGQQEPILQELYAKNKLIGNTTKRCPVCKNEAPLQSLFCDKCSWQFPKLYSLDGSKIPICDESQLALARSHWQNLNNTIKLQEDNKKLKEEKSKIDAECQKLRTSLAEKKRLEEETNAEEKVFSVEGVEFKMIRLEGDSMRTLYIGETQVTQALWHAVMGNNPSHFKGLNHPVECVSWNDICGKNGAEADPNCFLYKLNQKAGKNFNFRLPAEAEWEYAAKGGNKTKNYTYAGSEDIDKVAWYDGNSKNSTHPIKQLSPNELGFYDMSGNLWEWCEDFYEPSSSRRVLRGGSWRSGAKDCRVSNRYGSGPDNRRDNFGFRLVLSQ